MDETEHTEAEFGLIVSFEDQSPSYVHGYEAGGIWERMRGGHEAEIDAIVHTANAETLTRMAKAEGWSITLTPTEIEEWTTLRMEKVRKAPERPNPHGLRVV